MLDRIIAKHIGFPLQDRIKGTNIIKTLSLLKESQYWNDEQIYKYRLNKLKRLVDYARTNVPYYKNLFDRIKLSSSSIKSLDEIDKIPILTKEIVREQGENLVSREFSKFKVKKGKTGGTTGAPIITYSDSMARSFVWGSYYRWYEWMGLNYFDKTATLWGAKTVLTKSVIAHFKSNAIDFVQNNIIVDSFTMNQQSLPIIYKNIYKEKPLLLKGYLSSLIQFAEYINSNNLPFPRVKAISSTTETLLPHNRVFLEKVFGVPVFDQYGCGEVSAISYECVKHNGLHINQEHVICEVLNDKNTSVLNETGRIIVTDLDNSVMPFIRYENGDMATLSDKSCTCGINQPLMKSVEGRSIDTIILNNGTKVHGVFFTDILYELKIFTNEIQRFQIYQNTPGKIEIRIEVRSPLPVLTRSRLNDALYKFMDSVELIEMANLPLNANGKFSYIISDLC